MNERVGVSAWPLYWPLGWERTKLPRHAPFNQTTIYVQTQKVRRELELLGARNVVISSNLQLRQDGIPYSGQKIPSDAGIAVWFWLRVEGVKPTSNSIEPPHWKEHVMACDRWARPEHNLRAIVLHLASIRGQERWGVGTTQQVFGGFTALGEQSETSRNAWRVLGIAREGATTESVNAAYKRAALKAHPDTGTPREKWDELQAAREIALGEVSDGE
jgi:hypothetical protein